MTDRHILRTAGEMSSSVTVVKREPLQSPGRVRRAATTEVVGNAAIPGVANTQAQADSNANDLTTLPAGTYSASVGDILLLAATGTLTILAALGRWDYWVRYRLFLDDLRDHYRDQCNRQSKEEALGWLLGCLANPRLPDRRSRKSLLDDVWLILRVDQLGEKLRPLFRETRGYPRKRLRRLSEAAPAISDVLDRPWTPPDTVTGREPLMQFCYDTLGISAVRVSQARKRVLRHIVRR